MPVEADLMCISAGSFLLSFFFQLFERRSMTYRISRWMFVSIDLLTSVTTLKVPCGLGVVVSNYPTALTGSKCFS